MELPSWVSPEEDKPAPMPLLRVQSFINTLDIDQGTDLLREAETARAWLSASALIGPDTAIGPADLREARAVRDGLRALVDHNGGGPAPGPEDLQALNQLASRRRAAVTVDATGRVQLGAGTEADLLTGMLDLLLTVRDAQADGTWSRLKLCSNPDCRWAFFDRSRNRHGSWCTMAVCGNRLKNRRFRARA